MSSVSFRIAPRSVGDSGDSVSVFARISLLDRRGRRVPNEDFNELVPISSLEPDVLLLDLEPGVYAIEARLPNGELLADSVVVRESTPNSIVLWARSAPNEWLGDECFSEAPDRRRRREPTSQVTMPNRNAGHANASSSSSAEASSTSSSVSRGARRAKRPAFRDTEDEQAVPAQSMMEMPSSFERLDISRPFLGLDPIAEHRRLLERIGVGLETGNVVGPDWKRVPAVWRPDEPARIDPQRSIQILECSDYSYEPNFLQSSPWETLPNLVGSTANILAGLRLGTWRRVLDPTAGDDTGAAFRFSMSSVDPYSTVRSFAVVRRRMGLELVCLPTNFQGIESARFSDVGLTVQVPQFEHQFSTSVFVRDRKMALLLAFLSSGDLSMVSQLGAHSSLMLFDKNADPVAAAAGGYALVGSAVDDTRQPWHRWVENLMSRFKMPDGAILYGMMRLRLRSCRRDVTEAAEAFKRAYGQGLPIFGLGMRWLLEGLEQTSSIDEEAEAMAAAVRRLSFRLHPQSPFTILRLGKR